MDGEYKDPLHITSQKGINYITIKKEVDAEPVTNEPISLPLNIVVKEEVLDLGEDTFILNHEDDSKRFLCDQCGFVASSETMMTRHNSHHMSQLTFQLKQFKCTQCPYESGYRGDLNIHISKEHSSELIITPNSCNHSIVKAIENVINKNDSVIKDQPLGQTSITVKSENIIDLRKPVLKKDLWSRHEPQLHSPSPSKIYKCSQCEFRNTCKKIVIMHLDQHRLSKTLHTVKWYKCGLCSFKSNSEYIVRAHFPHYHLNNGVTSSKK